MKRFIFIISMAVLFFIDQSLSADFYAGWTVFSNHAVEVVPNFEKGTIDLPANSLFSEYSGEDFS